MATQAAEQHAAKKKKVKKVKTLLESGVSEQAGNSKFARALGSVDYQTREKGVQALTVFLQRRTDITEADMLKLWKGLFFCFWHSDKAPVQVCMAGQTLPHAGLPYVTIFCQAVHV